MARPKISIEVEDVRGSVSRLVREAPKVTKRFLSTAVFQTGAAVQRSMEVHAPFGPDGRGRTPGAHIRQDIEHRGAHGSLTARVGIFDDEDQVAVAMYNEYRPNRQPFMKVSAQENARGFEERAERALAQCERFLAQGF